MIVQLIPDQIAALWDYIKFAFMESMPPTVDKDKYDLNVVLSSLLSGKSQCWILYEKTAEGRRFEGVVITQIIYDNLADQRNLLIYSMYGDNVSEKSWRHGLVALAKWGLSKGCNALVAYTDNKVIINKVLQFSGTVTAFVSIPFTEKK